MAFSARSQYIDAAELWTDAPMASSSCDEPHSQLLKLIVGGQPGLSVIVMRSRLVETDDGDGRMQLLLSQARDAISGDVVGGPGPPSGAGDEIPRGKLPLTVAAIVALHTADLLQSTTLNSPALAPHTS